MKRDWDAYDWEALDNNMLGAVMNKHHAKNVIHYWNRYCATGKTFNTMVFHNTLSELLAVLEPYDKGEWFSFIAANTYHTADKFFYFDPAKGLVSFNSVSDDACPIDLTALCNYIIENVSHNDILVEFGVNWDEFTYRKGISND